jgi:hypothetical protein
LCRPATTALLAEHRRVGDAREEEVGDAVLGQAVVHGDEVVEVALGSRRAAADERCA